LLLRAQNLGKHFGGVSALQGVDLAFAQGAVHAVIGPNGAGKSTLVNVLAGELFASSGNVRMHDRDITRWPQPRRARAGIGRTYQRTTIFPRASVLENCRLSAQAHHQHPLNVWHAATRCEVSTRLAHQAIEQAGLSGQAHRIAGTLSHGQKRQLEIAMCLATSPQILLLDEPLAGMGAEESANMVDLIGRLAMTHAVLLVEHDMDAVFQLAKVLTVMANGKVLATGAPEEIRANREVQIAYLGAMKDALA